MNELSKLNRTIEWSEFLLRAEAGFGTLIVESTSMKSPARWWWTPENLANHSNRGSQLDGTPDDFKEVMARWFNEDAPLKDQFTSLNGRAILIVGTPQQRQAICNEGELPKYFRTLHIGPSWYRYSAEFPELSGATLPSNERS